MLKGGILVRMPCFMNTAFLGLGLFNWKKKNTLSTIFKLHSRHIPTCKMFTNLCTQLKKERKNNQPNLDLWMRICRPSPGSTIILKTGECLYLGDREKVNFETTSANTSFNSTMAKLRPKHKRGPKPNGTYVWGILQAPETPLANLSGLNSLASDPHILGSRWRVGISVQVHTPLGTLMCPIWVSSRASLETNAAGGYRRKASWITIVTCIGFTLLELLERTDAQKQIHVGNSSTIMW